jgi:hypothetical protein
VEGIVGEDGVREVKGVAEEDGVRVVKGKVVEKAKCENTLENRREDNRLKVYSDGGK